MIKDWLAEYKPQNKDEAHAALREIMQEVALAGLYRAGFFEKAAFYGGTALRIFYNLDRFSEDLDFSLLEVNTEFSLDRYLDAVHAEFESLGMKVSIRDKKKTIESQVESAFLKAETIWKELILEGVLPQAGLSQPVNIKIKIEVDTLPPPGFETEEKLLLKPFSFYVRCFSLPFLYAGKMHALLFRKWKNNVKGRDWYDLEWYIKNKTSLHLGHFVERAKASGDLPDEAFTEKDFRALLARKIDAVNMEKVKGDIIRFIPDGRKLEIWSPKYFHDLSRQLVVHA
ncbi:nucleotidyl transferase AbiEii/AbiGii toxin family protein [Fulvivirgaceae bacterium PWU5]|uniref:Nucleotidyl transferase AbiEii/AbiGii toxin family protein n=2 Tax=Dawidia cretensis TaxID=2782350 RepID=A0AAP2GNW0_9BACT|nr:nucleotidyl transferase AbiEii/AbiGii toxin family protein [Dawidia cretensis]